MDEMKPPLSSPYLAPGFYERALAAGRHRDIVGGRWGETGRAQLALLRAEGMEPHHKLLDIGAGALRLGCLAVPFLHPGHYWASDASRALMLHGRARELPDPAALPEAQLIEDSTFDLPGLPEDMDFAIAFGVFCHLPPEALRAALPQLRARLPHLRALLMTVFLAPPAAHGAAFRQADGVVTHPARPPYHLTEATLRDWAQAARWQISLRPDILPRGQILAVLTCLPDPNRNAA